MQKRAFYDRLLFGLGLLGILAQCRSPVTETSGKADKRPNKILIMVAPVPD
ncbi:hypothetical protein [Adhaeribacter rhizoryzae]|uniref:hypothetical protein n=1 Tax=Adhaeribacter rhizoryzae TaxID=2607907 RepID=UPI00167FE308|nr:hypothetical protein [Adhaeribacter rhizoryzae]